MATSLISIVGAVAKAADQPALEFVELIAVFLLWGPLAVGAVSSPLRWIYRMSPGPGKPENVFDDPRLVRFENGVVFRRVSSTAEGA